MRANRTLRHLAALIRKLPQLNEKEKDILLRRLKLTTLKKIGIRYRVTEGRIRQIEKQAIRKLKSKYYQQSIFK